MTCSVGQSHTITLSDDGVVYSFGQNDEGQLGLGHKKNVSFPRQIPDLPKIKQVSCGENFTFCVDEEGFIWSFGRNSNGQLGIKSPSSLLIPQKIKEDIPPVVSVSCGYSHTLIITNDSNLWSTGNNKFGQLCLGKEINQSSTFQKTSFSNILKISSGRCYSLIQNDKGEIFSCGFNSSGQCGLGHFYHPQITPSLIPNLPSNIIEFVCGSFHSLFLDCEGNVFSVGENEDGQLGLGHNQIQNVLNQIPNIPPIQYISCSHDSSYLIDLEGNVWSFGGNRAGQLGQGHRNDRNVPIKIESLKDIQKISYGSCGFHFLAKDSQNKIFVSGHNGYRQLGILDTNAGCAPNPKELNPEYFFIWGEVVKSKAKSARK